MPERWQREVEKLRGEEMPPGIRERAERGPQRELPHDGRQRLVAGLVAFAVFIAAGAFAWRAFDGDGAAEPAVDQRRAVVVELSADPFAATVRYGGTEQRGIQNGSSWETPDGINGSGGPYAIVFDSYLRVPAGAPITIRSDATELSVALEAHGGNMPGPARTVALNAGSGTLPTSFGQYAMQVTGHWDRGFATFAFGVQIVPPGDDEVVIALSGTKDGPTATVTSGGRTQEGALGSYDWCSTVEHSNVQEGAGEVASDAGVDGTDTCNGLDVFGLPRASGYLSVPGGASIVSAGDGLLTHLLIRTTAPHGDIGTIVSETDGTDARTPDAPGRYVVVVSGSWGDRGGGEFFFGIEVAPPADEIPEVLHLECTSQTASVDAAIVRARSDGVHIVVDASDEVRGVDIVTGPGAREFSGMGFFVDGRDAHVIPIEPGSWHVGCFGGGRSGVAPSDVGTDRAASFTVTDPDGFYAPVDLACEDFTTRLFPVTGTPSAGISDAYEPSSVTVEESAAAVPGILPTDVVRVAGYADGPGFKSGPLYSVLRDGRTVARLHVPVEVRSTWGVSVDACPGSGIGPDAPPGAAGPTPDTAVVRCLESRTELATPIVNTQADGLHIEVQNPYGSQALVIVGGWERDRIFTMPIADQAASIVVPVRPGHVQISCRSNAATENADPFEDRLSDGLQLQDRSGYFLPYAPSCDSSAEVPIVPPRVLDLPAGESYLRANLPGILRSDTVERAGYLGGRNDEGPWRIVRDGEIVAQVEFPSLEGITCRGAGINGRP